MADSPQILQDICAVFNMLHDGSIDEWEGNKELLRLKVGCTYLAELINKNYDSFYLELEKVDKLALQPWWNDLKRPDELFTALTEVFTCYEGIISADITGDHVTISVDHNDGDQLYSGGNLYLSCKAIRIYDDAMKQMKLSELDNVCRSYWDNFGKR